MIKITPMNSSKLISAFLLSGIILLISFSCKKKDDDGGCPTSIDHDSRLFADYSNSASAGPLLDIDFTESSDRINIETTPEITENSMNARITINYPAVTFREGRDVFQIEEISTERRATNCWIEDEENQLSWTFSKNLDVVLVLDVSSSLQENIATIKESAVQVVRNMLSQNPEVNIAVVKFSRGSVSTNLSSDEGSLTQFINVNTTYTPPDIAPYELEGKNETGLYEAINEAILILESSNARGKGILTFTDGVNNFWFNESFQSSESIIQSLTANDIANYTIGFDGNQNTVDRAALESIAINGDFSFPESIQDLEEVFRRFTNNVAAVYDLTYNTNSSQFSDPIEYRFLFKTQKIN